MTDVVGLFEIRSYIGYYLEGVVIRVIVNLIRREKITDMEKETDMDVGASIESSEIPALIEWKLNSDSNRPVG